jgi:ribosomal protein L16 Arg81 hydroxylase
VQPLDAKSIVSDVLRPLPYDDFFKDVVGKRPIALVKNGREDRARMIGPDPKAAILKAYKDYAPTLTCHALDPTGPRPSPHAVESPEAFQTLVDQYHNNGYTVRIPDVSQISSELADFVRALEILIENPVNVVIFWSQPGNKAPIHHDEYDLICIQLMGAKRWFISREPAKLSNPWKGLGEGQPDFEAYDTVDVGPGDIIYMPRGTAHTVQTSAESLHLSIGFSPVTLRDGMNAVLDHLSDLERPIRESLTTRPDQLSETGNHDIIIARIREGLNALMSKIDDPKFITDALERRKCRMIKDLPQLPAGDLNPPLHLDSLVKQTRHSLSHHMVSGEVIDFRQPGETILLHAGAEDSLRFIADTPAFKISDIPGDMPDDMRLALVKRFIASGFLEVET